MQKATHEALSHYAKQEETKMAGKGKHGFMVKGMTKAEHHPKHRGVKKSKKAKRERRKK